MNEIWAVLDIDNQKMHLVSGKDNLIASITLTYYKMLDRIKIEEKGSEIYVRRKISGKLELYAELLPVYEDSTHF